MENLLNVNQVAFILKVHPLTIRRYIKEGKLKAVRVAGNVRIKESDLQAFSRDFGTEPLSPVRATKKQQVMRTFDENDPFLKLKGRGASLHLTTL